jgi:hypothetical protein
LTKTELVAIFSEVLELLVVVMIVGRTGVGEVSGMPLVGAVLIRGAVVTSDKAGIEISEEDVVEDRVEEEVKDDEDELEGDDVVAIDTGLVTRDDEVDFEELELVSGSGLTMTVEVSEVTEDEDVELVVDGRSPTVWADSVPTPAGLELVVSGRAGTDVVLATVAEVVPGPEVLVTEELADVVVGGTVAVVITVVTVLAVRPPPAAEMLVSGYLMAGMLKTYIQLIHHHQC